MVGRKKVKQLLFSKPAVELPEEIEVDILLRLPVQTLVRFKCVCKSWGFFIDDPEFVKKHLNRVSKEAGQHNVTKVVFLANDSPSPTYQSIIYDDQSDRDDGFLEPSKLCFPLVQHHYYRVSGCCDGLLCLVNIYDCSVIIWNPSIRKYKELPVPNYYTFSDVYGFGYDPSIDDYKVVRTPCSSANTSCFEVAVLTLKTNSWRNIRAIPSSFIDFRHEVISTKGGLHWSVCSSSMHPKCLILCFDLVKEKFREVQLPCNAAEIEIYEFKLAILGGCLSVVVVPRSGDIAIWAMKEYDVRESWIKVFTIPSFITLPRHFSPLPGWNSQFHCQTKLLCLTKSDAVLISVKGEEYLVYNPKENSLKKLKVRGIKEWYGHTVYAESLVSPYDAN